jgi:cellulose synthase/poly-beta-1,6-N-acetylglucosamine synthase-like glycosyltransferase
MCNGANMSFRKSFFQAIGGFETDTRVSGDDLSLLHRAAQVGSGAVAWIVDRDALVVTDASSSFVGAITQRKRWLSKMSDFATLSSVMTGVLFLLAQLLLPSTLVAYSCSSSTANYLLVAVFIKSGVELLFISLAVPFFGEERIIRIFPAAVVLYNFISISAVFALLKRNVNWKERTWKMGRIQ